jgi:hypothetical protein
MTAPATTGTTVRVPIAIRRRGGRKVIITPDGASATGATAVPTRGDPALVKALARAHRWRRLLEYGRYRSLRGLAAAEGVDRGYVSQLLLLTLLAPEIVEAVLDGRWPAGLESPRTVPSLTSVWAEQCKALIASGQRQR